jgi:CRISPR/Cas system CSM-associated protein Csm2 small subunit
VDFYEEDIIEERRKDQVRKHKEKIEMKEKRHEEQRMQRRNPNNTSAWSPTDIGFEFAERVFNLMHIKPWQVTRSRFIYALADKRKEYGTTGDIEKVMIDLYFMQINHNKSITDPEIVWKRFILQFGNLLVEAKRTMVTPDEIETIKEESQSGREWLRNV